MRGPGHGSDIVPYVIIKGHLHYHYLVKTGFKYTGKNIPHNKNKVKGYKKQVKGFRALQMGVRQIST